MSLSTEPVSLASPWRWLRLGWADLCRNPLPGLVHGLLVTAFGALLLWLARDRMGKKPLYYGFAADGALVFGSELRALQAHPALEAKVDPDALALLLRLDYIPAPWSILRGVHKLPAGHSLLLRQGAPLPTASSRPPDSLLRTMTHHLRAHLVSRRRGLAALAMLATLGTSLLLGGCGTRDAAPESTIPAFANEVEASLVRAIVGLRENGLRHALGRANWALSVPQVATAYSELVSTGRLADIRERGHWKDYMAAYEQAIEQLLLQDTSGKSFAQLADERVFGLIGMAAYWHGKRAQQPRTRWWGVALMFYPYAVSRTWMLFAVGVALCAGLWLDMRRG